MAEKRTLAVLLIEDSTEYAQLIEYWLASAQGGVEFQLHWVSTLAAGLERLANGGVDAVLIDLGLPDCQGFDTYRRTREAAKEIPVVVLGSADLDAVDLEAIRQQGDGYIVKSACHAEALAQAVCRHAERIVVEGPEELPRELVAEYLDDCGNHLKELHAAIHNADYAQARVLGHQMKGTGRPYGFPTVTVLGAAIEQAAIRRETRELETQVAKLAEYLERVELA